MTMILYRYAAWAAEIVCAAAVGFSLLGPISAPFNLIVAGIASVGVWWFGRWRDRYAVEAIPFGMPLADVPEHTDAAAKDLRVTILALHTNLRTITEQTRDLTTNHVLLAQRAARLERERNHYKAKAARLQEIAAIVDRPESAKPHTARWPAIATQRPADERAAPSIDGPAFLAQITDGERSQGNGAAKE